MSLPSREEITKLIEAFTPYDIKGKSLEEICKIYVDTFGEDFIKRRSY